MSTEWRMPKPQIGDTVLFSKDYRDFSNPIVGWVMQEPGDATISIVTFTPTGYAMVYSSCHHKDDPALRQDHGWQDLGVWDFAASTKTIRELNSPAPTESKTNAGKPSNK